MKLNRELQLRILNLLAESYCCDTPPGTINALHGLSPGDGEALVMNMCYLQDHGLISAGLLDGMNGPELCNESAIAITVKGMDFLAEDGGLGAILNTVTVKLHEDTLSRIELFLAHSDLTTQEKHRFSLKLRELPPETVKHLYLRLVDLALEKAPDALQLIQKFLG